MESKSPIVNILKYIEQNLTEPLSSENISKNVGYSLYYFSRLFKAHVGFSPSLLRAFSFQIHYSKGGIYYMDHLFMQTTELHSTKEELYDLLIKSLNNNEINYNIQNLNKAYDFACDAHKNQKRYSGDDYVTHPLNVAILLSEMNGSEDAIISSLLHDITPFSFEQIKLEFSEKVADITQKVAKFNSSMEDEDVVMIKLADRLHNMRTIEFIDKSRWNEKAKETLDIFLPIASKLNNEKLISELNNLSVKYL